MRCFCYLCASLKKNMADGQRIIPINIEEEMKSAYIDYSMSVIVARALPDVRDGLKPVHRRIIYGMDGLGLSYNKQHKKSARIVGEVLGKYHPHGDGAVYDAMVRMAQDWSLRYPLVDGQGNFGSMDGDSPAAMRYTEARLARISEEMKSDLDKDTVDFQDNFDDSLKEPLVLPARIPNLLVNGASGIAVGMATNMLPHNLSEVIDGIIAAIDNPDITTEELMEFVKGPDFPTGGIIQGTDGIVEAFETGRGRIVVRGKAEIESDSDRDTIIISEIPYQVNKAQLIVKIAELVGEGRLTGISDVRDESDRRGLRIVVELKRDAIGKVVLSKLFKFAPLQSSYGVNNIALVKGRPILLNLKQMLLHFIDFRIEVIIRRTKYLLRKAEERAHILEGLLIALDQIDEVIALIRGSKNVDEAKVGLMEAFKLSEVQAKAILEMRLQKLTGLERQKVKEEHAELVEKIEHYSSILASDDMQKDIAKEELLEVKERYGDERKTDITHSDGEISIEDMIPNDEVVITISHLGYIKRTKASEFKRQGRGGRGSRGSKTRETDFIEHLFITNNHNWLLLFTEQGRCFWLRVYEIPEASKTATGRVLQNILPIPKDDKIKAYIRIEDLRDETFLNNNFIVFSTRKGIIKKTIVEKFSRPRTKGINAITIREGDQLLEARRTDGNYEILLAQREGMLARFNESQIRPSGRGSMGVIGIRMKGDNEVVGMVCVKPEGEPASILVVSEKGFAKRSSVDGYRLTKRGAKGVKTMRITDKTGKLVTIKNVDDEDDLMITTREGITIRMAASDIREIGRDTQGVKAIRLDDKDDIADVAVIKRSEGEDEEE